LHQRGEAVKAAELERARRLLAGGQPPEQVLEALAHALTSKFLHGPTRLLNGHGDDRDRMLQLVDHLLADRSNSATDGSDPRH
jgi:glutamyl-tRNA reductase